MRIRVLRDPPAAAAWNMAVDEALLVAGGPPTLRLYGWSPHAVSLGYFQRLTDFADLPAGTTVVRRLTGGGAIHHGDERTFSLALDAELLPRDVDASYRLLHAAVIAALRTIGSGGELVQVGEAPSARPDERWCFRMPGRGDVVTAKGKLLGSAQRRVHVGKPRILHHGSLVLERPELTPFVAALVDDAPMDAARRARLDDALVIALADAIGLAPAPGELTPAERDLAQGLAAGRYADPAFLGRR